MTKILSLTIMFVALLCIGCSGGSSESSSSATPSTETVKAAPKASGQPGAQAGAMEAKPLISESEANSHVGSKSGN